MTKQEQARKNRRAGKRVQGKIAKLHNAQNVGGLGGEDCCHNVFSIEAKNRKAFVGEKWIQQAEANCPSGKIPLVHIHLTNEQHCNDLIMVRFRDWQNIID